MCIKLPILYGNEKNGKIKVWSAIISKINENMSISEISFGYIDGKKQIIKREYTIGKNINKKNETTPHEQCILETKKKWKNKLEKEGYREEKDEKEEKEKIFPMLAQTYDPNNTKKKKNISFPCYVQPKIDGLRCLIYKNGNNIITQSRTGMYFITLQHITNELNNFFNYFPDTILDGELYTTKYSFEELAGIIKKKKINLEDTEKIKYIEYYIYDIVNDLVFEKRLEFIQKNINFINTIKTPTYIIKNKEEFKQKFSDFVEDGYEGIILRNKYGLYKQKVRSHDLQKYKEFIEDEYTIVDYKEGEGRDKGTVIWICETQNGNKFSVRPKGTIENRKDFFNNGQKYIGKKLTVIFQELSELKIPRFPVGKDIRYDY
jgi:ATP-dependent DNA ligase